MKCIKYIWILAVVAMVSLVAACADDDWYEGSVKEGEPVDVTLNFDVLAPKERTSRAAQDVKTEYYVYNLYVMVFNASGSRVDNIDDSFFEENDIQSKHDKANDSDATSTGQVTVKAVTGKDMTIVGIANVEKSSADVTKSQLDAVKSLTDLNNITTKLKEGNNVFRGAAFLMTGYAADNSGKNAITILSGSKVDATIKLERIDAKVTFKVTGKNEKYNNFVFTPRTIRICQAPVSTYLMERSQLTDGTFVRHTTLNDVLAQSMDANGEVFVSNEQKFESGNSFTFYMYENLQKPKNLISNASEPSDLKDRTDKEWQYACRDEQNKNADGTNADYKYAADNATYAEITGELTYNDKGQTYVFADLKYTVHLGYAKEDGPSADDYRTMRNTHYTYNITITGVNSLIAEVEQDREERPGAEGYVVISDSEIKTFDSHYCRTKFTISSDVDLSNLLFSVTTPFENGIQKADGTSDLHDYKWVKFLINSDYSVSDNTFAAYPGEQCYDGGSSDEGAGEASGAYSNKSVVLRDAKQLIKYLSNHKSEYTNGVTVTAFIDEYLYFYDPINGSYKAPNSNDITADDLLLWKKSVGGSNRILNLVQGGDKTFSKDGETSVSHAVVSFVQRPIETIYNKDADDLKTAWGCEMVNETGKLNLSQTSTYSYTSSENDGLTNSRNLFAQKRQWANVVSNTSENALRSNYNDPMYACALRNRDFNGDGNIDQNEIVWYLASIKEYQDLYIGEDALSEPLFVSGNDDDKVNRNNSDPKGEQYLRHYASSTLSSNSSGYPKIYWSEEYGATSNNSEIFGWINSSFSQRTYKCLRRLGQKYNDTSSPQTYYTITGGTPNLNSLTHSTTSVYQFDLSHLNSKCLRSSLAYSTALPYVNLGVDGENNKPAKKFKVAASSDICGPYWSGSYWSGNTNYEWGKLYQAENGSSAYSRPWATNSSTTGYRIPNQREFILMINYLDGWAGSDRNYTMRNAQLIKKVDGTETYGFFVWSPNGNLARRTDGTSSSLEGLTRPGDLYIRPVIDVE